MASINFFTRRGTCRLCHNNLNDYASQGPRNSALNFSHFLGILK